MPKEKPQPLVAAKRAKVEGAFVIMKIKKTRRLTAMKNLDTLLIVLKIIYQIILILNELG